jgi:hypothetical protein
MPANTTNGMTVSEFFNAKLSGMPESMNEPAIRAAKKTNRQTSDAGVNTIARIKASSTTVFVLASSLCSGELAYE